MTEIPTACDDWSLNIHDEKDADAELAGQRFYWNKTYSLSIWEKQIKITKPTESITDFDVWRGFLRFQVDTVYKLCAICNGPEDNTDMRICCYCGNTVHAECSSGPPDKEQIAWKPANRGFEKHLVVCLACDDKMPADGKTREVTMHVDDARRCALRTLALSDEIGKELTARCHVIIGYPGLDEGEKMLEVQNVNAAFFQPGDSAKWLVRKPVPTKCGGLGVFAACDIPRFSIVGVYPGYEDPLSGEHAKVGRPGPKYSLVDLNCADYWNRVFPEYDRCFTPFINEPNAEPKEESNVAWIQETCQQKGRLSVMSVRDIKAGEELLIGYGPLYPRTYPYTYDAYALHSVDGYDNCFALWHWATIDEKDAEFVCYVEYDAEENAYAYWETEEEAEARRMREAATESRVAAEKAAAIERH